jgi:hypothetical protein
MKIVGIENLSAAQIRDEVQRGGKFVYFQFCISVIIMTFRRPSEIHFVRSDESAVAKGLSYSLISFFAGWWGIPWGPIYTVGSLVSNFRGGKDVTAHVLANLPQPAA